MCDPLTPLCRYYTICKMLLLHVQVQIMTFKAVSWLLHPSSCNSVFLMVLNVILSSRCTRILLRSCPRSVPVRQILLIYKKTNIMVTSNYTGSCTERVQLERATIYNERKSSITMSAYFFKKICRTSILFVGLW